MTYATGTYADFMPSGRLRASRKRSVPILPALVGLAGSALVGALLLDVDPAMAPGTLRFEARPSQRTAVEAIAAAPAIDLAIALAFSPAPLGQAAPLASAWAPTASAPAVVAETATTAVVAEAVAPLPPMRPEVDDPIGSLPASNASPLVAAVPLPVPRPADGIERPAPGPPARAPNRMAARAAPAAAAPADTRSVFDKLFGVAPRPAGPALAYAAPEDGVMSHLFGSSAPANPGRQTAVYDISSHTVYLPNGTRLEAHSGLGSLLDDPRSIAAKNRGVTPPSLYDLTLREKLFHGVRAIRLTPVGNDRVFGRVGLLAHTFMLGPNGDSNGCVSFRNYDAFLQAYLSGDIRRLQVVTHRS